MIFLSFFLSNFFAFKSDRANKASDGFRVANRALDSSRDGEQRCALPIRDNPSTNVHQLELNLNKSHFQLRVGFLLTRDEYETRPLYEHVGFA